ncbi:MAG: hypothetical protein GEV08_25535 [Acidimicrobiia bacterium]|nr:hypothetical protein [Acidimicrobiia bacterium]
MSTSTPTHDAIGELLDSVDGKLLDRSRVVDALLDLRLLATGEPSILEAIDALLGAVPGRNMVEAEWYVDALNNLFALDNEDLATN